MFRSIITMYRCSQEQVNAILTLLEKPSLELWQRKVKRATEHCKSPTSCREPFASGTAWGKQIFVSLTCLLWQGVNGTVCIQQVAMNSTSPGQFALRVSWNILNYELTLPMSVLHPGSAENEHVGLQTSLLHRICLF